MKSKQSKVKLYSEEFRERTLALAATGAKPVAQVARDLGIPVGTLRVWQHKARKSGMARNLKPLDVKERLRQLEKDNQRLIRENRVLQEEREILKKAAAFFAKESE
jgi:transposase